MDIQVSHYIEYLWEHGEGRSSAADTLSSIQFFLGVRRRLPLGWQLLTTCQQFALPARAPPLTVPLLTGMAGAALSQGHADVAAGLLLAFHCLLRTRELLNLTCNNIQLNNSYGGVISLGLTKGGSRRGMVEDVILDDPHIGFFLQFILSQRAPGEPLIRLTPHAFRSLFLQTFAVSRA